MQIDKIIYQVQPYAGVYYPSMPDRVFQRGIAATVILNGEPYHMRFNINDGVLAADCTFRPDDARVLNHLLDSKQLSTIKKEATLHLRAHH
jgi:hypothetical protein